MELGAADLVEVEITRPSPALVEEAFPDRFDGAHVLHAFGEPLHPDRRREVLRVGPAASLAGGVRCPSCGSAAGGRAMAATIPNRTGSYRAEATIRPIITAAVAAGALIHTDEYDIYARMPAWKSGATSTRAGSANSDRSIGGVSA